MDFFLGGGHFRPRFETNEMNFTSAHAQGGARDVQKFLHGHVHLALAQMIRKARPANGLGGEFLLLTHGGACNVNRYVTAADDNDLFADREAVAEVDVEKKVDALHDAVEFMARQIQVAAAMKAEGEQYSFVPLRAQVRERKIFSESRVQAQLRAEVEDLANLRLQDIPGQTILRNTEMHHSARHRRGFKDSDGVAEQRQIVRGGKPGGTSADDSNFFRMEDLRFFGEEI